MALNIIAELAYLEDLAEPVTTGTFDVVAGEVIVQLGHCDESGDTSGVSSVSVTDNQAPDLTWSAILERGAQLIGTNAGFVGAKWAPCPGAISGLTVTTDFIGNTGTADCFIRMLGFSGDVSLTDPIGTSTSANMTTDPLTTASITPETSGYGVCAFSDWAAATHTLTSSDLTVSSYALTSGNMDGGSGYKTLTAGVGATANLNSAATPDGNYIWFEIRSEAAGGGSIVPGLLRQYRERRHRTSPFPPLPFHPRIHARILAEVARIDGRVYMRTNRLPQWTQQPPVGRQRRAA